MSDYWIVACRLCGKLMKRYSMEVVPGDSTCCRDCNDRVEDKLY